MSLSVLVPRSSVPVIKRRLVIIKDENLTEVKMPNRHMLLKKVVEAGDSPLPVQLFHSEEERNDIITQHKKGRGWRLEVLIEVAALLHGKIFKWEFDITDKKKVFSHRETIAYTCLICGNLNKPEPYAFLNKGLICTHKIRWNDIKKVEKAAVELYGAGKFEFYDPPGGIKTAKTRFQIKCVRHQFLFETDTSSLIIAKHDCRKCYLDSLSEFTLGEYLNRLTAANGDNFYCELSESPEAMAKKVPCDFIVPLACTKCNDTRQVRVQTFGQTVRVCIFCGDRSKYCATNLIPRCEKIHPPGKFSYGDVNKIDFSKGVDSVIEVTCLKPGCGTVSPMRIRFHILGRGCNKCKNNVSTGEILCREILDEWKCEYLLNFKFFGTRWPYDATLEKLKLILEIDGHQHFRYVPHMHNYSMDYYDKMRNRDILKTINALKNGYRMIRIDAKSIKFMRSIIQNVIRYFIDNPENILAFSGGEDYNWILTSVELSEYIGTITEIPADQSVIQDWVVPTSGLAPLVI